MGEVGEDFVPLPGRVVKPPTFGKGRGGTIGRGLRASPHTPIVLVSHFFKGDYLKNILIIFNFY